MPNPSSPATLRGKLTTLDRVQGMAARSVKPLVVVGRSSVLQVVGSLPAPGARLKSHALPFNTPMSDRRIVVPVGAAHEH